MTRFEPAFDRGIALLAALIFGLSLAASALPVKPDVEKILQRQEQHPRHYQPARAGWDGPEMAPPEQASRNPVYEAYGPASTVRAVHAALKAAAKPDPVAVLAIGFLILLLRIARQQRVARERAVVTPIAPAFSHDHRRAA